MKRYLYRCLGKCCKPFESKEVDGAVCPKCGSIGRRVFDSVPLYHPTKGAK